MSKRREDEAFGKALELWEAPAGAGDPLVCVATSFTFNATFFETEVSRAIPCRCRRILPESESVGYLIEREEKLASARVCALVGPAACPRQGKPPVGCHRSAGSQRYTTRQGCSPHLGQSRTCDHRVRQPHRTRLSQESGSIRLDRGVKNRRWRPGGGRANHRFSGGSARTRCR